MKRKTFIKLAIGGGIGLVGVPWICSCQANNILRELGGNVPAKRMRDFSTLPNWENGTFKNLEPTPLATHGNSAKLSKNLKWLFFPEHELPKNLVPEKLPENAFPSTPDADFRACWLGHSSLIFELAGTRFATDLVFENAAPFPWIVGRYAPPPFPRERLPKLDFLLISHDHYDHLERATIKFLCKTQPELVFVTCLGVGEHLQHWGVPAERIFELNWGETLVRGNVKIHCLPSRHFSGRSLNNRCQTLWASFVFESQNRRIFFGADGGFGEHFEKIIAPKFDGFDLAMFEIDAWNDNWPNIHMTPAQAILAGTQIRARAVMPIHWATFNLARHQWQESVELLIKSAQEFAGTPNELQLVFPRLGELFDLRNLPRETWWRGIS